MNHFWIRLWRSTKSVFYMTTSYGQISGWTKKQLHSTSQSQTCTKKQVMVTDGPLPVWSTIVFWIPAKSLHLRSRLSKSMRCTEHCNACSQHWSIERAHLFSTPMPNCMSHNQHVKSWKNWATKFCLIRHIHLTSCQPTTTSFSIPTTFCRKTLPQPAGGRKCFPRICQIPMHGFLCCRDKQPYFLLAKMCWL